MPTTVEHGFNKRKIRSTNNLERLKREGKPITMFHLNDGTKVAGSVISHDKDKIKLDTGDGIIFIPKSDIQMRKEL